MYDAFTSFRETTEPTLEKIARIEIAIRDQIDMIHHVNERVAIFDERHNTDVHRIEARLDALDSKIAEGFGQAGSHTELKFLMDDLKARIESCEKDDTQ